ncbi:MAG: serine hydroxymethyltransferase [Candidatus Hydrogenedentota bacterium]
MGLLSTFDPEIFQAIKNEEYRQMMHLEMIASENFVSPAVLEAQACVMTNKYAEGYPGKRYYAGCEFVDVAEQLAIDRTKSIFKCEHANVQPHSGSQANMAVYMCLLNPGDTILGMSLSHGGHLTHGSPVNFSGKLYKVVSYGVDPETEVLNYDEILKIAEQTRPKLIMCGASAYPRIIRFDRFKEIADKVGAFLVADIAHIAGLIATDLHPSPEPYCDFVTTTTHKTLRGPRGGIVMCKEKFAKDLDKTVFPGEQGGPFMHTIAAKAVCLKEVMSESFKIYSQQIIKNAKRLADVLISKGFRLISNGTDNHLMLVDLTDKNITGKDAEKTLEKIGITVNKNTVPRETRSPFVASGIRIGTPAITTRGMKEKEMEKIGEWIAYVLSDITNDKRIGSIKEEVLKLCKNYPLFKEEWN